MAKVSAILPSRDEKYLAATIHDLFRNARGDFEIVAVIDSDKWPENWKALTDQYPNLHTIHHGEPKGLRAAVNSGVASAKSRGAKYILKLDAHCGVGEGFDEILKADYEDDWIVVPRRKRLNPEAWELTDTHKPDVDYHYLSFPDDPKDFGGPGLNGKIWPERARDRAQYNLDEEMSSQGSGYFLSVDYFYRLELMDEANYGKFWNEFQELGLKCWLSGGRVMVNKRTWYSHWHKGKSGRGYRLPESWLQQGATFTKNWIWNEAWPKQTLPFSWLIEHFWPVPTWPENWEEVLYATRRPRSVAGTSNDLSVDLAGHPCPAVPDMLTVHAARYGISDDDYIDVRERLKSLAKNGGFDFIVNNSTLTPGQNPFRGKKKHLTIEYSFGMEGERVKRVVEEKDWLIIGPVQQSWPASVETPVILESQLQLNVSVENHTPAQIQQVRQAIAPKTATALNDYLIRKFSISPQRLRGPMPIELRDFHRNDLAQLFAELGFKRGAEIGVAEGKYSEILVKANPECELLLVDPWHAYSDNPQHKSKEKHEHAYNETLKKVKDFPNTKVCMDYSMSAVGDFDNNYFDYAYIDGNHLFDFAMQDLIEWSKRVRSGGIVSGDDYYALDQKRWVGGGVVEAVQAYTNAHRIPVWYIFQGHKSVDFMWVKP